MIETPRPEYQAVSFRPAGFWVRVLAYVIDAFLFGIVVSVLANLQPGDTSCVGSPTQYVCNTTHPTNGGFGTLVAGIYFVLLWATWGQTLGMRVLGLRVLRADGSKVGFGTAILRYFGLLISFAVCFVGVIWVAFDSQHRGWHDRFAGTVVVHV